jgi:hypothetical protein
MSTDWIEVHDHGSVYMAKVFLTDDDRAYMVTVQNGKKRFFKVDAGLLKLGELRFFEKVMENAEELLQNQFIKIGLI